jgi:hypothetical protein
MLREIHKSSLLENEEKVNLLLAIDEVNAMTLECDAKVDEMAKKMELVDLSHKLYLRPGMERVELNLDHLGRELLFKGDLQRAGSNRFTWLETHAILFDHYLVLAKTIPRREGGTTQEVYDVSKLVSTKLRYNCPDTVSQFLCNCLYLRAPMTRPWSSRPSRVWPSLQVCVRLTPEAENFRFPRTGRALRRRTRKARTGLAYQ